MGLAGTSIIIHQSHATGKSLAKEKFAVGDVPSETFERPALITELDPHHQLLGQWAARTLEWVASPSSRGSA